MMRFRYTAVSPVGDVVGGEIEAADRRDALGQLRRQSLEPVTIQRGSQSRLSRILNTDIPLSRGGRLRAQSDFCADLALLRSAGAALDEALAILAEGRDEVAELATRVRVRTGSGLALSAALARESAHFDEPSIALVATGEVSGDLAGALTLLAELTDETLRTRADVRRSLLYPATLVFVSILVILLMLFYVLPTFAELIAESGKSVPPTASVVFAVAGFLTEWGGMFLISLVLGAFAAFALLLVTGRRRILDRIVLELPFIGKLLANFELGRSILICGRLLEAGCAADEAVDLAARTCTNSLFREDFHRAADRIREGGSAREALSGIRRLPNRAARMIGIGERTGALPAMMIQVSAMVLGAARRRLDTLVTLLPVVLTIVVGGVVAALVYSILAVLLSLNELAF